VVIDEGTVTNLGAKGALERLVQLRRTLEGTPGAMLTVRWRITRTGPMSVPLVPSTSQIEAQLEAMLAKSADERVLGMRSSMPHAWPETIQARGKPFRLVWRETGRELREQLASLEDDPEARSAPKCPRRRPRRGSPPPVDRLPHTCTQIELAPAAYRDGR
jgi:hypothetical protein